MSLDNKHDGENESSVLSDVQIAEDYNAFIESITELITDYYGLELFVKASDCEESCENAFIVKNEDKSCWLELNIKLIVVNQNCDGVEIESVAGNDQTKKQTTSIRINKEKFVMYDDDPDSRWDAHFGEPSTKEFTVDEFLKWFDDVMKFE